MRSVPSADTRVMKTATKNLVAGASDEKMMAGMVDGVRNIVARDLNTDDRMTTIARNDGRNMDVQTITDAPRGRSTDGLMTTAVERDKTITVTTIAARVDGKSLSVLTIRTKRDAMRWKC